jgi:hypothetical protein
MRDNCSVSVCGVASFEGGSGPVMDGFVDLIVALGQWLRSTPLAGAALKIQKTPASRFVDEHAWAEPTLQSIHILALSMLAGSVLMICLRMFGVAGRSRSLPQTLQRFMPVVWGALLVMALSGAGLILGDVVRNLTNPVFWGKMILIAFAALLALAFQACVRRGAAFWEAGQDGRVVVRALAAGALVLWWLILIAGRWIAFVPT